MSAKLRLTLSIALALVLMFFALGLTAQVMAGGSDRTGEVEITATVDAVGVGTITVDGLVIQIAQAEINDPFTVGSFVKVHYSVAVDGSLVAREIELALEVTREAANDDFPGHDVNDDHGNDGAQHDQNDDRGNDGAQHDQNDDHSNDGAQHDQNDNRGHQGAEDRGGNSGRGNGGQDDGGHHGSGRHGG